MRVLRDECAHSQELNRRGCGGQETRLYQAVVVDLAGKPAPFLMGLLGPFTGQRFVAVIDRMALRLGRSHPR
jgi:hypothetical protein